MGTSRPLVDTEDMAIETGARSHGLGGSITGDVTDGQASDDEGSRGKKRSKGLGRMGQQ